MRIDTAFAIICLFGLASPVGAQAPLSAIDWLDAAPAERGTVTPPRTAPPVSQGGLRNALPSEPPVAETAVVPKVSVQSLDAPTSAAVGLLPASVTGLPKDLWQQSSGEALARQLTALDVTEYPALLSLLYTLLLAEADPASSQPEALLKARVDVLMDLGAVEPARALLERADPQTPALFPEWFDLSLLAGDPNAACKALKANPRLTQDLPTRVFCTSRLGDWSAAATLVQTGAALGDIPEPTADLLSRFLDPELAEELPPLPPARDVTPLTYRLLEAIGEAVPTARLPRVIAFADLSGDGGWKAQLEAVERLARVGAVSENRLLGIYTDRIPSASGGIWDRVEAFQRFETALNAGDPGAVGRSLIRVWPYMRDAGLSVPFANLFGQDVLRFPLNDEARHVAARVGLLSPAYETAASKLPQDMPSRGLLAAIATGQPPEALASAPLLRTIGQAFQPAGLDASVAARVSRQGLGATILDTMADFAGGAAGDLPRLRRALVTLRALGLEDTARRAALHLLLGVAPA